MMSLLQNEASWDRPVLWRGRLRTAWGRGGTGPHVMMLLWEHPGMLHSMIDRRILAGALSAALQEVPEQCK